MINKLLEHLVLIDFYNNITYNNMGILDWGLWIAIHNPQSPIPKH